ncbi:MAG: 2OG-Fe(II) oxygenase [Hyphomonadaceae bacterium]
MSLIDLAALERTPLARDPYEHLVTPGFVAGDALKAVIADYPDVPGAGSYPPDVLTVQGAFAQLVADIQGPAFRDAIARKFGIDLSGLPTMYTVRGWCRQDDGKIHTDSKTKVITVLLYLNEAWEADGGRLRLLRSENLDDAAAEVPPHGGTLLAFKRSDHSWHGHEPFEGRRRALQLNWVTGADVVAREQFRHKMSAAAKSLFGAKKAG